MLSLNLIKFLGLFAFVLVMSSACRYCQKSGSGTPTPVPFVAEELKSEIPFSTKEPENFQVEIVTTANERESKTFTARAGNNRRFDYNFGAKNQVTSLWTDKNYLIIESRKIYTENAPENAAASESEADFLTTGWLSAGADVKFSSEGRENNLARYRVVFGEAGNSESLIFIDENVSLPVRQEFYSRDGEQRTLTMTVELKNLKLEAEAGLFAVPSNFRKVSNEEFRSILKKVNE